MKNLLLFLGIAGAGLYLASHLEAGKRKNKVQMGDEDLLDLNAAELDVLTAFHDLGDDLALRIVENRPYATKIDLIGRMIVSPDMYELIKHEITVRHAA